MSSCAEKNMTIREFLEKIHLEKYYKYFLDFGYITVLDCAEINNEILQQLGIPFTGHRKRILKQLEISFSKIKEDSEICEGFLVGNDDWATEDKHSEFCDEDSIMCNINPNELKKITQTSLEVQTNMAAGKDPSLTKTELAKSGTCPSMSHDGNQQDSEGRKDISANQNLKCSGDTIVSKGIENKASTAVCESPTKENMLVKEEANSNLLSDAVGVPSISCFSSVVCSSSEDLSIENEHLPLEKIEHISDGATDTEYFEFKGDMKVNQLYSRLEDVAKEKLATTPEPSRSFKLRNRPVPEIPGSYQDSVTYGSLQERRNICMLNKLPAESPTSPAQNVSSEQTPSVISPYGETFFFNNLGICQETFGNELPVTEKAKIDEEDVSLNKPWKYCISEDQEEKEMTFHEENDIFPERSSLESEYSTVEECTQNLRTRNVEAPKNHSLACIWNQKEKFWSFGNRMSYTLPTQGVPEPIDDLETAVHSDSPISPYACFYGSSTKTVKSGWLDKLSPQGSYMFQKRWVKFDGDSLSYYNNEKEVYSKGVIPLSAITKVRVHGENKFEVITAHRTFVFRVEKDVGDRNEWIRILQNALMSHHEASCTPTSVTSDKSGYLELKGYKAKIFAVLHGNKVLLCKSEQDAKIGLAITKIPMNVASIKQSDRKCFEITTPFKSFSFTAESEREKQEWIEAVQQSIAETLSDYEVAEKIWFNEANRRCADCQAPNPDWASINLCVVICKNCAGQHRSLGPKMSKVRSLKMDANIWSNELVELFIVVGNKSANVFWEANLQSEEKLHMDSPPEQRKTFIIQKYQEGKFRRKIVASTPQQLNQALCAAVVKEDVLETMMLLFSGADVMCATGDPLHSTPYLLAKEAGQCLQMEFLHHNKFSDYPMCDPQFESELHQDSSDSTFLCGFLYNASSITAKIFTEKKLKEEMIRRWCTLEGGFLSYYENDKSATPYGTIDIQEIICLVVHSADLFLNTRLIFTFEMYLLSEQIILFGTESAESRKKWIQALSKCFVPTLAEHLMEKDYDVIGHLYYKDSCSLDQWKEGWFALDNPYLHYCPQETSNTEELINLRRLQELTISTMVQNGGKIDVLLLVEKGRTFYIHGHTQLDFLAWSTAVEKAAGTTGDALQDQQLGKNDVPIIVNSCIEFITQYGLGYKFIYLTNGSPSTVNELLDNFKKDARNVKLRTGKHQLEDVTDVLKCYLSNIDDALLTKELYPYWISALDTQDKKERVEKYGTFIRTLPPVNKATLAALVGHLYRVQKCAEINNMNTLNLAKAFSSCLFQTKGQNEEEVKVTEDLIDNYVQLFQINEDQVKQMDIENSFITKWKDIQISRAGDLLVEVYVEKKEPDYCVILKVSPTMEAEELINGVLGIKNITPDKMIIWILYEAIENGELERPLHSKEKILEQVLQWGSLAEPGSAYLIVKRLTDAIKEQFDNSTADGGKAGYLKYKEEPSKFLSGNKFQERYFVLQEGKLFLFKDMKSNKPEKALTVTSLKVYAGVKKKMKPPMSWGFTVYSEKYQWHLCCDVQELQMEWVASILWAQNVKLESGKLKLIEQGTKEEHSLKQRISLLANCLERKEEIKHNRMKKHRSLICLADATDVDSFVGDMQPRSSIESKTMKKQEEKTKQVTMGSSNKLPSNVIEELNVVLQKTRNLHEEQ
nr:arf-GAP with Rho-GAP domain, ANK repeat and PH domain-containing protein 2 isoform X2 [Geotrypetes seraphini]XP_033803587.1 arf-GAP with Rho-GAP domain, ANK repeat and PH domain-containing protein 2 isoform X2 [Geotrypetes seraphini]XP_033803596.1 arf-GAP with Rho-GAP domain, ANK repeat and PH domain-containing protein 2 isoform X2 [Geotrypetes seraphini]XP_033803606.1 arf-GAP with Rho-GAP domain, ANK repeat and PH domain-containing protein 2 isoform X2 [Geotrypetes seraphini]XP_033803615.1 